MKPTKLLLLLMLITSVSYGQKKAKTVSVNDVLNEVNASFTNANILLDKEGKGVKIDEASVSFSVAKSRTSEGGVKILIFKLGRKWSKEKESTITFNLERDAKIAPLTVQEDELTRLIVDAAKAFSDIIPVQQLKAKNFEIEIAFAITRTTSGGLEFTVLSSDLSASREWEKKVSHTLTLTLSNPDKQTASSN